MADTSAKSALAPILPFDGMFYPATAKKNAATVVLVPFYKAKRKALQRHIRWLNELGFDCVDFALKPIWDKHWYEYDETLYSSQEQLGVKHIWADQVEAILNALPGEKIIYAFSNPSASAIEAIARRHATDILGLICDSGPAFDLLTCMRNYYKYEEPQPRPKRWLMALSLSLMFSPQFKSELQADLKLFPEKFRILSIRGWKDRIIPTQDIDKVFEPHQHLDWQRLSLPQAGHVNGLRDFYDEYAPAVESFLTAIKRPSLVGKMELSNNPD